MTAAEAVILFYLSARNEIPEITLFEMKMGVPLCKWWFYDLYQVLIQAVLLDWCYIGEIYDS